MRLITLCWVSGQLAGFRATSAMRRGDGVPADIKQTFQDAGAVIGRYLLYALKELAAQGPRVLGPFRSSAEGSGFKENLLLARRREWPQVANESIKHWSD